MKRKIIFMVLLLLSLIAIPVYADNTDINSEEIIVSTVENQTYNGKNIKPVLTIMHNEQLLQEDKDYILEYKNNIESGTATITITGINEYTGTKNITFEINKAKISNLKYENLKNYTFTGNRINQNLKITHNGIKLDNTKDYTLEYKNNKNAGTATVIVTGIGNYYGSKELNFKIYKRNISAASTSNITTKIYTGSYIKPTLSLTYNGYNLTKGVSYKVSYKNNKNIGVATITITGINNYTGKITKTFKIIPKKTTISSSKFSGQKITLKWKKVINATGYKIYMAKGNNSYSLYKTIKGNSILKYTTPKLNRGTTYHFFIRSYKIVNGKIYYSNKSNEKSVRIPTLAELNAKKKALEYLDFMAFSRQGLIEQLEYEGFTHSQSVYGVDHTGANWYTQAVRCAKSYLSWGSFSRSELIEQLEYEGFTNGQAVYAVNQVGL